MRKTSRKDHHLYEEMTIITVCKSDDVQVGAWRPSGSNTILDTTSSATKPSRGAMNRDGPSSVAGRSLPIPIPEQGEEAKWGAPVQGPNLVYCRSKRSECNKRRRG
jgi:hypothetical protein